MKRARSGDEVGSAFRPLRLFARVRSRADCTRRGRRCPPWAHAGAAGAARRLHCAARSGVAPQNSLRSLRSLRSDNCGESVDDARWRAPTPALRCSSPQKSPPPGIACRECHRQSHASRRMPSMHLQRRVRAGCSAPLGRREAQGLRPRAQRELATDLSQLSERSERSERSEFCDGAARPTQRARTQNSPLRTVLCLASALALASAKAAGESARSADRSSEALRPARMRLCRTTRGTGSGRSWTTISRSQTCRTWIGFMCRGTRQAPRSH